MVEKACLTRIQVSPPIGAVAIKENKIVERQKMKGFFTITPILVQCLGQLATRMKWILMGNRSESIHNMKQENEFPYSRQGHISQTVFVTICNKKTENQFL